jgi:hypothetical protein
MYKDRCLLVWMQHFQTRGLSAFFMVGKPLQEGVHVCCFSIFKSIANRAKVIEFRVTVGLRNQNFKFFQENSENN